MLCTLSRTYSNRFCLVRNFAYLVKKENKKCTKCLSSFHRLHLFISYYLNLLSVVSRIDAFGICIQSPEQSAHPCSLISAFGVRCYCAFSIYIIFKSADRGLEKRCVLVYAYCRRAACASAQSVKRLCCSRL